MASLDTDPDEMRGTEVPSPSPHVVILNAPPLDLSLGLSDFQNMSQKLGLSINSRVFYARLSSTLAPHLPPRWKTDTKFPILVLKELEHGVYRKREFPAGSVINHHHFNDKGSDWIVMPRACHGSLIDVLSHFTLSERSIATIIKEIVIALRTLHNKKSYLGDLKLGNILLDHERVILSPSFHLPFLPLSHGHWTYWTDPQFSSLSQSPSLDGIQRSDIFSLGILLLELVHGKSPTNSLLSQDIPFIQARLGPHAATKQHESIVCNPALREFIESCIRENPYDRPTADELLRLDFLQDTATRQVILREIQDSRDATRNKKATRWTLGNNLSLTPSF